MSPLDDFLTADYARVVRSVAVASGDVGAAEDAVQTALVRALEHLARGRPIVDFPAWVFVCASNANRRRLRRRDTERRAMEKLAPLHARTTQEPSDARFDLWPAVASLPLRQRQSVILFYLHDLEVAAIAALLEVSEGTVKSALHRARASLATALAPEDVRTPVEEEPDHAR